MTSGIIDSTFTKVPWTRLRNTLSSPPGTQPLLDILAPVDDPSPGEELLRAPGVCLKGEPGRRVPV